MTAALRGFARNEPLATAAALFIVVLVAVSLLAPVLPLGDPTKLLSAPKFTPPRPGLWLGSDELGRDYLPRVVQSIWYTVAAAGAAVLLTGVVGTAIGMAGGYFGGLADMLALRLSDTLIALPGVLLGLLCAAMFGPGLVTIGVVIFAITLPLFVRVARVETRSIAGRDFVVLAELSGAGAGRILWRHLLPNILGLVLVQGAYALSLGMLTEAGLSFLGLGLQPPAASLGSLMRGGTVYLTTAPWLVLTAGGILTLVIIAVNLVADGLSNHLDPLPRVSLR